uniref:Protein kinase domain-containing protein n=1 Tax=Oryza brachyantha TaxID=4533 RepID=J3MA97_ORYBR
MKGRYNSSPIMLPRCSITCATSGAQRAPGSSICDSSTREALLLRLPGVGLVGRVPQGTLGALRGLRVLSLRANRLFGDVPGDLFSLPELRALFLQGNLFSGALPPDVAKLTALEHLALSHNNLSGAIPFALNGLAGLHSLRLDGNRFSGSLPSLTLPLLEFFNVSYNQLNGSIPTSLSRFPPESFAGNLQLCGKPLNRSCEPFFPGRLKEVAASRREFSGHLDSLGKVEHRNLLPVRGYYFSKDEKLLVCDYVPAGSLSAMLHGSRGTGRTTMDWDARMRAALSAARGVAHLHAEHSLAHGNVKSSNLLIRPDPDAAALSDYCLHQLFAPSSVRPNAGGYRAPELVDTRRPTFKSDVYALGVLFLELLTGKPPGTASVDGDGAVDLPRWVQSVVFDAELVRLGGGAEEEMVALLQVAMSCVATAPDARPDTADVVRMVEEIGSGHGRTTKEESEGRGASEEERSRGTPPAGTTP